MLRKAEDSSWLRARDVLVSATRVFALRRPPGASPQGGASTPNPRGKEAPSPLSFTRLALNPPKECGGNGLSERWRGARARGGAQVQASSYIFPDNWLQHRSLTFPFPLSTSQPQTAMLQEKKSTGKVSSKRSQEAVVPGHPTLQSDPDSEIPLVSLIWPQIHSFFHNPAPTRGRWKKGGWVHKVGSCTDRVSRPGQESWRCQALCRCP